MKLFLSRLLLFALIQVPIAWLLISQGTAPSDETNSYLGAIIDKQKMLKSVTGPRMIFVGGSNVAFGIDGSQIQQKTGLQPINFGLHASLGLYFPLNVVQRYAKPGDIVIVSPEYALLASPLNRGGTTYLNEVASLWPEGRIHFSKQSNWKRFLDREGLELIHHWVYRGKRRLFGDRAANLEGTYQRKHFNEFGDMVGHRDKPSTADQDYSAIRCQVQHLEDSVARLNSFCQSCQRNGIQVYFSYPPLPHRLIRKSHAELAAIDEFLRDNLEIPMLDSPERSGFSIEKFYDSRYHLTESGATLRTRRIIESLDEMHQPTSQKFAERQRLRH